MKTHKCRRCGHAIVWADIKGKRVALDSKPTHLYAIVGESGEAETHRVVGYGHAPHRCGNESEFSERQTRRND